LDEARRAGVDHVGVTPRVGDAAGRPHAEIIANPIGLLGVLRRL
jgi:hypothetical protein